ncbi:MAG: sulfatase-like hydrolase/transferase, partial [Flavobacteriales bacterium]|nr:sulfatase-like hydrolase/transferase [Flavobacteriales bacterium]
LKQFFENVKYTHWFKNTLFVFTADHSSEAFHPFYSTFVGQKAIPIFIYDPSSQLKGVDSNYIQHTDITPTLLNLLGINTSIVSFGKDVLSNKNNHLIGYTSNNFYYVEKEFVLLFDGEKATGFYNLLSDSTLQQNLITDSSIEIRKNEFEKKLKAILQQYNNRLINNQLSKESIK